MGNALDYVLQLRREKAQREQNIGNAIAGGVQGGIDNFLKVKQGQRQQEQLLINQQKHELNQKLVNSTIEKNLLDAENSRLQSEQFNRFMKLASGESSGTSPAFTTMTHKGMTITNPQAKAREAAIIADAKPLAGDTARMFSGATQGLSDIKDIQDVFQFKQDAEGNITSKDFTKKQKRLLRDKLLKEAGVGKPGSVIQIVSGSFADEFARMFGISTEEGRNLALKFSTLAENNLRARTGAQAPEPEKVAEELRTIIDALDNPATAFEKLKESENFLAGIVKEIRPLREVPKTGLSGTSKKTFNSPEEADNSGLPTGTIVMVQGRRYQI